jgi:hypothetical protein
LSCLAVFPLVLWIFCCFWNKAGIPGAQLTLALEPESAALYCQSGTHLSGLEPMHVFFFSFWEHYAYEKSVFITHKIPPQSKSRNLSPGCIGSKPDRCVPDWQYNAADSGSNASVSA